MENSPYAYRLPTLMILARRAGFEDECPHMEVLEGQFGIPSLALMPDEQEVRAVGRSKAKKRIFINDLGRIRRTGPDYYGPAKSHALDHWCAERPIKSR